MMNKKELEAFAHKAAGTLNIENDLYEFHRMLTKATVEAALNPELDEPMGYERHEISGASKRRNGYSRKTLRAEDGQLELSTPRDREGVFEPQRVKKSKFTSSQ